DTTLVFGPVSKSSKNFKPANFGADVAFVSLNHPDMNGGDEAERGEKHPFVISGPGEYEVKDVTAAGFPASSKYGLPAMPAHAGQAGGSVLTNTVYSVHFDGLSIMYLGALGDFDLPAEVLEMDSPDILIIPIGGGFSTDSLGLGVLTPSDAQKLAVKLEAKIVIPILFDDKSLKQFLKEAGQDVVQIEKFTVKPRDVIEKEGEVVVLSS
ncbi:MAG: MBL fold metallo-hydrolase, partial [Patescibacteria group bacterium]